MRQLTDGCEDIQGIVSASPSVPCEWVPYGAGVMGEGKGGEEEGREGMGVQL